MLINIGILMEHSIWDHQSLLIILIVSNWNIEILYYNTEVLSIGGDNLNK